jgi:FkbM family methyltransferase
VAQGEVTVKGAGRFYLEAPRAEDLERWTRKIGDGTWEANVISLLIAELRPGDVFLDVGAYVGFYSLLAASKVRPTGRVVALEPDPGVLPYLRRTLARNKALVEVYSTAIASEQGEMHFSASSDKRSRLSTDGDIQVVANSLDRVCEQLKLTPSVVKIDIEGGESCFWPTMPTVLRRARLVVMEIHPSAMSRHGVELDQYLELLAPFQLLQRKSDRTFHISFGTRG